MLKKIAAAAVLAGALAFSAAAPAVLSAGSIADTTGGSSIAVGNWPDPMRAAQAVGNWPDPMSKPVKEKNKDTTYTTNVGNWPDPM